MPQLMILSLFVVLFSIYFAIPGESIVLFLHELKITAALWVPFVLKLEMGKEEKRSSLEDFFYLIG